jgi:F-type H+-transporting ATPase subunit b
MDNPLVRIEPGLVIWTIGIFLLLVGLLRWKAWGPIVAAIETREKSIKDAIDDANRQRDEAMRLLEEQKRQTDQARAEVARMLDQGRKDAEASRAELIDKARHEAGTVVEQGRRQIERETRAAVQELKSETANLAILAAGRIVKVSLDETSQKRIVEECLKDIGEQRRTH